MEFVFIILAAAFIYALMQRGKSKRSPATKPKTQNKNDISSYPSVMDGKKKIPEWLVERWELAEFKSDDKKGLFPKWYFDPITDRQQDRLEDEGWDDLYDLTKGQASDLIGLNESADEDDLDILKFFKISTRGSSQTHASHYSTLIMLDEENREKWANRPANNLQKEFYKFAGLKAPANLTHTDALKFQQKYAEENNEKIEDWYNLESIIDMVEEKDFRETHNIKKPTISVIRSAYDSLKNKGLSHDDMYSEESHIVSELLLIKPELAK